MEDGGGRRKWRWSTSKVENILKEGKGKSWKVDKFLWKYKLYSCLATYKGTSNSKFTGSFSFFISSLHIYLEQLCGIINVRYCWPEMYCVVRCNVFFRMWY